MSYRKHFTNLAKKTLGEDGGGQWAGNINMGMEAKDHALHGSFCNWENEQNPFGCVEQSRAGVPIMARRVKESPNERGKVNSSTQCVK